MRALRALLLVVPLAQLPSLPQLPVPVPLDLGRSVGDVTDRLSQRPLAELRQLRVQELLRTQRRLVEPDPDGEPIVRHEVLAYSPSAEALSLAVAAGFAIVRERELAGLGAKVVVLGAPPKMSTRRALAKLRQLDPVGTYDFNHLYISSGEVAGHAMSSARPAQNPSHALNVSDRWWERSIRIAQMERTAQAESAPSSQGAPSAVRVGLVDGGVDTSHPVFEGVLIHRHGCGDRPAPSPHGTAVASLIAGHAGKFQGGAPGAELYAADIYCDRPTGGAMDDIAEAIGWIVGQKVPVINVSLVGPKNALLEDVVRAASARGHLIVAAVGNDGPAARPLYPAAYPDVVGVTAVDVKQRVLLEACRGPHVDFAAPGADMAAAILSSAYSPVRGTSFAAPLVASLLAAQLHDPDKAAAQEAVASLARLAVDLGDKGVDTVYGNGLVGGSLRVDPSLAKALPDPAK